jgi:hypothetical protein
MKTITEALQVGKIIEGGALNILTEARLMKAKLALEKALVRVNFLLKKQEILKINELSTTVKEALTEINNITSSAMENHQTLKRQQL